MADFELGVCSGAARFVSDQDLEKALAKVLETFDGVENLSAEQRDGIANFVRRHDVLAVLPTGYGKSLLFQLIPKLCVELHYLGYSYYPKSLIMIVICPLNALIECHMKQSWSIEEFRALVYLATMPTTESKTKSCNT